ncbi:NYN domain-containing protein [Pulveribacter sp.]|uniref:NYN domain-containing protein n=1 Tax=Pulveribacter sp. TaxID=2678893 RepID=UPI0028997A61|nr:NYN domain-containing protein [Pulveribacter sp.]
MPDSERGLRIALLIDADNAPAEKIDEILTELSTLGEINIRRAYGNWTKHGLQGWQSRLLEFGIRPIQQFDYSRRKNATDMAMTVDAMELLYTDRPDAFGIVSSDADFTPLVMHLRAKGSAVYGFGAEQTPKPFVNACSRFLYLESLTGEPEGEADVVRAAGQPADALPAEPTEPVPPPQELPAPGVPTRPATLRVPTTALRQDTRLLNLLRHAVQACQDEDGWARVGALGTQIGNKTSFDARNYGYATLSKLLAATQAFELRDEGTPRVAVRDKRSARTPQPPLHGAAG